MYLQTRNCSQHEESSKTEKQNICHAILTLQSPVFLTDLWQVIKTNQPPVTRMTFVTWTKTPCPYIFIQEDYAFTMKFSMVWTWKEREATWRVREDKSHHSSKSRYFRFSSQGRQRSKNTNTKSRHSAEWLSPKQLQIKSLVLQSRTNNRWKIWPENAAGTQANSFSVNWVSWTGSLNYSGWAAGSCSAHSRCSHRAVHLFMAQRGKK